MWQQQDEEVNVVIIPKERYNDPDVIEAKQAEIENWKKMEAVDVVDDNDQKVRLVIRWFEEDEEIQVDAPTAAKVTLRTVLAIAANEDWILKTIDFKSAFLQGRPIERSVYLIPPGEAERKVMETSQNSL